MANPKLILMDDVHLEGRELGEQIKFADEINEQIQKIKDEGDIPIVICAGDIGEGINGAKWIAQLQAEVIYVCGNHEFWNQDFFETNEAIKNYIKEPNHKHIHFLSNETIILHNIRFIGSTLWTGMGEYLPWVSKNHIIKFHAAMGDFKRITAEKWYNPNNETRLKTFLSHHGIDEDKIKEIIASKSFNPLIEREENRKSIEYLEEQLQKQYDGQTVVVSHHLPVYELWMKQKEMPEESVSGEIINVERPFYEAAKGNDGIYRDILMMGYYANNLKDLFYDELSPQYWLHGHLHQSMSEIIGRTKVISSPVGYKKQSSEIKYKVISLEKNDSKKFLVDYIKKEIEEYNWTSNLINPLRELEAMIIKFEKAVAIGMLTPSDFDSILKIFLQKHTLNLKELKMKVNNWFKLFLYDLNPKVNKENIDFYTTIKVSGLYDFKIIQEGKADLKYKFPELLAAAVNENSFLDENSYQQKNKNNLQYHHYKEWLKEIQKIQIQISQYKKFLLAYCEQYK